MIGSIAPNQNGKPPVDYGEHRRNVMARTNKNGYSGIRIRSNLVRFSTKFCEIFIKDNKFVSPKWCSETGILELTFYLVDSDISFRLPIQRHEHNVYAANTKFFSALRPFKMGRYKAFDIDLDSSGNPTLKFELEK